MNKFISRLLWFGVWLSVAVLLIVIIANPALAPTKQISILGASDSERAQLADFSSYSLDANQEPEKIQAASYLIKNLNNGSIVLKKYSHNPLPMASLTKLMTAWVVIKHGSLGDTYKISADDQLNISPALGLVKDDEVKVSDLFNSMLIGSANDAATALGNYVSLKSGKPIAEVMNEEAKNIGLADSRFQNPVGFDSVSNYTSSEDIVILVEQLLKVNAFSESKRAQEYSFESLKGRTYQVNATNKLINNYSDLSAIKTGFTNTALGSMVTILNYENEDYLIIIIGSPDREKDTLSLRNYIKTK